MRIKFKNTERQVQLLKDTVSKDKVKALTAQEAFAALMQPVVNEVLQQADTTAGMWETFTFNEGDDPSLPLDPFRNLLDEYISYWTQEVAGGLPRNHVSLPTDEIKFTTYNLDSAISWDKKFARKGRLDVIGGFLTRMVQELLLKTNRNSWATLMTSVANASHNINGTASSHVFRATTTDAFNMDEMNYWFTLMRRLNASWASGTPTESGRRLADLWCSPEFVEKIRSLAYNPVNTLGANNVAGTQYSGVVTLSEAQRQALLNTAGAENFMGVNLNILDELGEGTYKYNVLFNEAAGATTYSNKAAGGTAAFDHTAEEIVIGLGPGTVGFRPTEISDSEDNPSAFVLQPDDQYQTRSEKVGYYGKISLGHLIIDTRSQSGFII